MSAKIICLKHDYTQFEEGYYGYRCPKCRMFIPFGCEFWLDSEWVDLGDDFVDWG